MKKLIYVPVFLLSVFTMWGCSDSSSTGPDPDSSEAPQVKQFVYNAMNEWYLWQKNVPDLADDRFGDDAEKQQFLNSYSSASNLFDHLQVSDDKYSFFIDDYEEYERENNGVYAAYGFNYGYVDYDNSNRIFAYIRYVVDASPADEAGLQRYDIFTKVDGVQLTDDNYSSFLRDNEPHDLTLADIGANSQGLTFNETQTVSVGSREVEEDPIFYTSVIDTSGKKIGYMMFNAFHSNNHQHLNQEMGDFKSQGINDLVLDLRYNGGGAVITSETLSSMISGLDDSHIFAKFTYNDKKSSNNQTDYFLEEVPIEDANGDFTDSEPMNTLGLNHLYVLVSQSTASASEALINSLRPFIDVTIIGTETEGKDVGSITLYDAPPNYSNKTNINHDHKNAIQPIVVSFVNADDQNYPDGFQAEGFDPSLNDGYGACLDDPNDNCVSEITYQTLTDKPAVGSKDDPLLARAIDLITGQTQTKAAKIRPELLEARLVMDSDELHPARKRMYIEPFMLPKYDQK